MVTLPVLRLASYRRAAVLTSPARHLEAKSAVAFVLSRLVVPAPWLAGDAIRLSRRVCRAVVRAGQGVALTFDADTRTTLLLASRAERVAVRASTTVTAGAGETVLLAHSFSAPSRRGHTSHEKPLALRSSASRFFRCLAVLSSRRARAAMSCLLARHRRWQTRHWPLLLTLIGRAPHVGHSSPSLLRDMPSLEAALWTLQTERPRSLPSCVAPNLAKLFRYSRSVVVHGRHVQIGLSAEPSLPGVYPRGAFTQISPPLSRSRILHIDCPYSLLAARREWLRQRIDAVKLPCEASL